MSESKRKIATLLAADLIDNRRLAEASDAPFENAFEARLENARRLIIEHGGQWLARGDSGLLAKFRNVAAAIHCAVAIQQTVSKENDNLPPDRRTSFRIGLNVGDVSEEEQRLHGDGVDAAVGLAALTVPGGVCLASSVYEHVKHKVHVGFDYVGEKKIKGVLEPVAIYQIIEPGVERGFFSLWEEFRRRHVFKVAAAYAVVMWILVQVANIVLPTFNVPSWAMRGFVLLAVLGFPVALVLAWLYELTPMGLRRSDDVLRPVNADSLGHKRLNVGIIGLLVVALVVLVFDNYFSTESGETLPPELDSIAILAFQNFSPDPDDVYFADGLADELLSVLGRVRELRVASRTASFYFKDKDVDIATIASTLMVGHVLSGGVRRYGSRIRVTAALDDTKTGGLLWSDTYDTDLSDILEIQSDIARSVVTAIVPVLSQRSEQQIELRPTESTEAYDYYLRGRDYIRRPAEEATLASAIQLFDRAIDLDPRFAQAYAGLCEAYLGDFHFAGRSESFEQAEVACRRALALNDNLWEVHVALGNLYRYSGQYDKSVMELQAAIAQQPTAVNPYLELAQAYAAQDLNDRAEEIFRRAEQVESHYWGVHNFFGNFLWDLSRYDEAVERYRRVIQLAPDSGVGYDNLGNTYLALGELDQAEAAFNASPIPSRWTYTNRGLVYYYRGQFEKAAEDEQRAISMAPEVHSSWGRLADAYRFLPGAEQKAQAAYEKAIELAERELSINPNDWDTLARLNLYYLHAGQPDRAAAGLDTLFKLTSDPTAYYFAALVTVRLGDLERTYEYLRKTVASGWSRATVAADPDLASLRGNPEFEAIVAEPTG